MTSLTDNILSVTALDVAARKLDCTVADLSTQPVSGGYSLNRRALVSYANAWLFVKEVDTTLLESDGNEELQWLKKDYELTNLLRRDVPELVSDWAELHANEHVLLMSSYRQEEGWLWTPPTDSNLQAAYIQAVIDATKRLEQITFDQPTIERLNLQSFFRDELAFDNGIELITENDEIRRRLSEKFAALMEREEQPWLAHAYEHIHTLMQDNEKLARLRAHAKELVNQADDLFNHCDVRSDNIAYNPLTGSVKFVDWNWASFAPAKFGSTEFLVDMARRGVNITPWLDQLNPELLADTVGYYAKRCLKDPLSPESTLRDMQAQSAAVALTLYNAVVTNT
jgi:hypothetical protein